MDERLKFRALLMDFDGTIVDSMGTLHKALNITLRKYKLPEISAELFGELAGLPLKNILLKIDPSLKDSTIKQFGNDFNKIFLEIANYQTIPKVKDTLEYLHQRSILLGLLTTTPRNPTFYDLNRFKLIQYFDLVLTNEDVQNHKPSPEIILKAIEILKVPVNECAYVGDSPVDILAGKAAGIKTIAVLSGLCGRERLERENPDIIINSVTDLPIIIF